MEFTCQANLDKLQSYSTAISTDAKVEQKVKDETTKAIAEEQAKVLISNDAYAIVEAIRSLKNG